MEPPKSKLHELYKEEKLSDPTTYILIHVFDESSVSDLSICAPRPVSFGNDKQDETDSNLVLRKASLQRAFEFINQKCASEGELRFNLQAEIGGKDVFIGEAVYLLNINKEFPPSDCFRDLLLDMIDMATMRGQGERFERISSLSNFPIKLKDGDICTYVKFNPFVSQ